MQGWEQCDKTVVFFFVHGFHDVVQIIVIPWSVACFPVMEVVLLQAIYIEYIGTTHGHVESEVLDEVAFDIR